MNTLDKEGQIYDKSNSTKNLQLMKNNPHSYEDKTVHGPLLSLIIPTRNRQKYCIEVLRHILSLELNNMEIIVQDNSDEDILKEFLSGSEFKDKIKYNYISGILSFVDNFSQAIIKSTGEYICMIGDDDTVLPNIIDVASYAKTHNIDAVIPELCTYFWPSLKPINIKWENGYLATLPFRSHQYKKINVSQSLTHLIGTHFQNYQELNVPRIYHGIVKRSCIEEVKNRSGVYFGGLTPDMFMSVALCFTVKNAVKYTMPFTISGICPKSGSADSATGKHTGELKDAPHFRGHDEYNWLPEVPYIYTVETIWAETGLKAIKMMGEEKWYKFYNIKNFLIRLNHKYPQFKSRLIEFGNRYDVSESVIVGSNDNLKKHFKHFTSNLKKLLTLNFAKKYYNVESIDLACRILSSKFKI